MWGDFNLVCPTVLFGEEFAKNSPANRVYSFRLMQPTPPAPNTPKWMGVTHGSVKSFLYSPQFAKLDPQYSRLSQDMIHAWTAFAKTGTPSKMGGSVVWEQAVARNRSDFSTSYIHLEWGHYRMVPGYFKQTCDSFWKPKIFA